MQAAETSTNDRARPRSAPASNVHAASATADTISLLDALPIAAGVFGLKNGKLWVHALNARFLEISGCDGSPEQFLPYFMRHSDSGGGDFVRAFLADAVNSPDQNDYSDGCLLYTSDAADD